MQMTKILGLTGGIASGKTTISNYFRNLNIPIVDGDLLAREVMQAGKPIIAEIVGAFGPEVLSENGEINRVELGRIIFGSADKRKILDDIVQPKIRSAIKKEMENYLKDKPDLLVLDLPLLYEQKYDEDVDEVMVIYVDKETQQDRLLKRNPSLSKKDAVNRIQSQMPLLEKAERADIVIDNNGSIEDSVHQVRQWLETYFEEE